MKKLTYEQRLRAYEAEKQSLKELSPKDYEIAIKELAERLDL